MNKGITAFISCFHIGLMAQPGVSLSHTIIAEALGGQLVQQEALPKPEAFPVRFGSALKARLNSELSDSRLSGFIPQFHLALRSDGLEILTYGYQELAFANKEDRFALFEADGFQFFVTRGKVRKMIRGKTIEIGENGLFIVD